MCLGRRRRQQYSGRVSLLRSTDSSMIVIATIFITQVLCFYNLNAFHITALLFVLRTTLGEITQVPSQNYVLVFVPRTVALRSFHISRRGRSFSPMPCLLYLVIFAINRWLVSHAEDHYAYMPRGFCSKSNDSFLHNVINSNARHSGRGRTPLSSAE